MLPEKDLVCLLDANIYGALGFLRQLSFVHGGESRPKKRNGRAIASCLVFHSWHRNSVTFFSEIPRSVPQEVHSWTGRWIHRRYWQKGNGGTLKFRMIWVVLKSVRAWPWGVLPATCQSCHPCSLALQVSAVVGDSVTWHPGRGFPSPCWNPRRWANSTLSFTN